MPSLPERAWDFKKPVCYGMARRQPIKGKINILLYLLTFPGMFLCWIQGTNKAVLPVLSFFCQREIWYPCCAWQFRAQVLVATGRVLYKPSQMDFHSLNTGNINWKPIAFLTPCLIIIIIIFITSIVTLFLFQPLCLLSHGFLHFVLLLLDLSLSVRNYTHRFKTFF